MVKSLAEGLTLQNWSRDSNPSPADRPWVLSDPRRPGPPSRLHPPVVGRTDIDKSGPVFEAQILSGQLGSRRGAGTLALGPGQS